MSRALDELTWEAGYARLSPAFYARVAPEPLAAPYLVAFNPDAASLIGLDPAAARTPAFADTIAGRRAWPGADPVAMRYAGHQFGVWVRQLGDGRAHVLGDVIGPDGARTEVQLKGSGRTPFSRGGDGRAALRSTVREYLGSEAMAGLGIPTTRALAIVGSDEPVYRERAEPSAVLVRLAPSHVRFGSAEVFAHAGEPERVRELVDFVIATQALGVAPGDHAGFFREVVRRTAELVAAWQAVGFTHGVMNTDNMSLLGLTLDYGPFAFVEGFDPGFVPNHSDEGGRYALGRQPAVALWNLGCLAEALVPLISVDDARAALASYGPTFAAAHEARFAAKLGIAEGGGSRGLAERGAEGPLIGGSRGLAERGAEGPLIGGLLRVLASQRVDYPRFFRLLGSFAEPAGRDALAALFEDPRGFDAWAGFYARRLAADGRDPAERRAAMERVNPKYVLRTHLAQRAIERAEQRDFREIERLRALLAAPFDEQPEHDADAHPAPAGTCDLSLSCSS